MFGTVSTLLQSKLLVLSGEPDPPFERQPLNLKTKGTIAMSVMMIRAKVKPENASDVETAAKTMFDSLNKVKPQGVQYASSKLADGQTFVILLALESPADNPLPAIPEFRVFQEGLKGWLAEPPASEPLFVIGSYNLF
jgi:hypothetical protein